MKRLIVAFLCCLCLFSATAADLFYRVSFTPEEQYINVELTASQLQGDQTLLKMPVWAPGYYLIVDYPKNLVDFAATDPQGAALTWEKQGKNGWLIRHKGVSEVKVTYRIFANEQSVAECMVKPEKAFIAPNGVFMHIDGHKELPIEVELQPAAGWKNISTGLDRVKGKTNTYVASDADCLYDSPIYLGNQKLLPFELDGRSYEIALETPEGVEKTTFVEDVKKMIQSTTKLMGNEVPYQHYSFILMGKGGGGLEHHNSQACFTDGSFLFKDRAAYLGFLSFVTHEYFHLYNVKAIRPIELGPFDYDREVLTPSLWISEGFTVYYETAILRRAGLMNSDDVRTALSEFIQTTEKYNGHKHMSLRQSSYDIWLNFFNRNANGNDTRVSYYIKGPVLGLLMDIEIRDLTQNKKSLDDVMRTLYKTYYQEKQRGFTEEEFWQVCTEVAGSPLTEMRRYVETTCEIDYERCLDKAGLTLDSDYMIQKKACSGLKKQIQDAVL